MNITGYQFMQPLKVTKCTSEQLVHKLPNYNMVNYESQKEIIQKVMKTTLVYAYLAHNLH